MIENLENRFEKTIIALGEVGANYAKAKAQSWFMQETRKALLAVEAGKYQGSEACKERLARASKAYKVHLEGTREAIHKEFKFKVEYDKLRNQFEAYRSLMSLEKAKMNLT